MTAQIVVAFAGAAVAAWRCARSEDGQSAQHSMLNMCKGDT
jgi:hypothetical protein